MLLSLLRYLSPRLMHEASRHEAAIIMFGCVQDLLEKMGVNAHVVGVLDQHEYLVRSDRDGHEKQ
jgi:hypothetical protein